MVLWRLGTPLFPQVHGCLHPCMLKSESEKVPFWTMDIRVSALILRGIRWNLEDRLLKPCVSYGSRLQAEVKSDSTLNIFCPALPLAEHSLYATKFCYICKLLPPPLFFFTEELEICKEFCSSVYRDPRCKEWMKRSYQLHLHRVLLWETVIGINSSLLLYGSHTTTSEGARSWQICGVWCTVPGILSSCKWLLMYERQSRKPVTAELPLIWLLLLVVKFAFVCSSNRTRLFKIHWKGP